jgi:hypothetical protein
MTEAKAMTAPRYTADDYELVADAVMEDAACDHRSIAAMLRQAAETERKYEARERALEAFRAWLAGDVFTTGIVSANLRPVLAEFDRRFGRTP